MTIGRCALSLAAGLFLWTAPLLAATRTWTGGGTGDSADWTQPANWGGIAPSPGDDLVFPAVADNAFARAPHNDFAAGTAFHSITFTSGPYTVDGNPILLTGSVSTTDGQNNLLVIQVGLAQNQTWTATGSASLMATNVSVNGNTLTLTTATTASLSVDVSGSGSVLATAGNVSLGGTFAGVATNNGAVVSLSTFLGTFTQTAGTARATGVNGNITINGGTFEPGSSNQSVASTGNLTLASGTTWHERFVPCEECTGTVSTDVTGTVNLNGATLSMTDPFYVAGTIINNDESDPVTGTFAGLPEGSTIKTSSGQTFTLTYHGGTGNDVVLLAPAKPSSATALTSSVNPSQPGQSITFTATVTPNVGTGTVTFFDGSFALSEQPLTDAGNGSWVATFTTSELAEGSHSMVARYSGNDSFEGSVSPTLVQAIGVAPAAPDVTFAAAPSSIPHSGSSTLTWSVTNATSVVIDHGLGAQPLAGSAVVQPASTTTYTLTATGAGGTTVRQATVTVVAGPAITFTAAPPTIVVGQSSTLSWSTDATSVTIDHGIGSRAPVGSIVVAPSTTTVYRLTATGPGGVAEATVTVKVGVPRGHAVRH